VAAVVRTFTLQWIAVYVCETNRKVFGKSVSFLSPCGVNSRKKTRFEDKGFLERMLACARACVVAASQRAAAATTS